MDLIVLNELNEKYLLKTKYLVYKKKLNNLCGMVLKEKIRKQRFHGEGKTK